METLFGASLPDQLIDDVDGPGHLFIQGRWQYGKPLVGIVGARRCTGYGRAVAEKFGYQLSCHGVGVVSGLAAGIDAAAHHGAMRAHDEGYESFPVGVVAGGVDVVYPIQNRKLWNQVSEVGAIVSEYDQGTSCEPWRFPHRNRIIAALCDVLLVVESTKRSGTKHTVDAAIKRGKTVMAVPGPITSLQSEGTNDLLREGCAPACDIDDLLVALSLEASESSQTTLFAWPKLEDNLRLIVDELGFQTLTTTTIAESLNIHFQEATKQLFELEKLGLIVREGPGWRVV